MSPLCESYLDEVRLNDMEPFYPLHALVCHKCFLVQLLEYVTADHIFSEYAYFSSYSTSWVEHARTYVETIRRRLHLTEKSFVVEIASNDGYLLQHFVKAGIPVLGIEPAANIAQAAREKYIAALDIFTECGMALDYKSVANELAELQRTLGEAALSTIGRAWKRRSSGIAPNFKNEFRRPLEVSLSFNFRLKWASNP
jgi:hypothetical protein